MGIAYLPLNLLGALCHRCFTPSADGEGDLDTKLGLLNWHSRENLNMRVGVSPRVDRYIETHKVGVSWGGVCAERGKGVA